MEKRRFQRIAIAQTATLQGQYSGLVTGEIHDFSTNGVLFSVNAKQSLADFHEQQVDVRFRSNLDQAEYALNGRVVRIAGFSLGLIISPFPEQAYMALLALAKSAPAPVTTKQTQSHSHSHSQQQNLAKCHEIYQQFIKQVIDHFYLSLANRINFSANNAGSLEDRWIINNAYPLIDAQRLKIERAFLADDYTQRKLASDQLPTAKDADSLSLVALDEFDEWLTVSTLTTKLDQEFSASIFEFETRYAILLGQSLSGQDNPYGPSFLLQTLRDVIADAHFKSPVLSVLYRLFYESILASMGDFYQQLNACLGYIDLPQVRVTPSTARQPFVAASNPSPLSPVFPEQTAAFTQNMASSGRDYPSAEQQSISLEGFLSNIKTMLPNYSTQQPVGAMETYPFLSSAPAFAQGGMVGSEYGLHQLVTHSQPSINHTSATSVDSIIDYLRQLPPASSTSSQMTSVVPAAHTVFNSSEAFKQSEGGIQPTANEISQLINALNAHQSHWHEISGQGNAPDIANWLRGVAPQIPEESDLWQSVRLFDQLFTTPLASDELSSDIKELLKKLELTLLKLALLDNAFLSSSKHPAQQTVNLIERFYIAADDDGHLFDPQLRQLLHTLVNQIVDQFEQNNHIFDDVNHILEELVLPIEQTREEKVKLTASACEQRERMQPTLDIKLDHVDDAITMLRTGAWLCILVDEVLVPYQIIWMNQIASAYILMNRSATLIREFHKDTLADALLAGSVTMDHEFDLPFMERTARKVMFSAYDQVYRKVMQDDFSGLLNRKGLMAKLEEACIRYIAQQVDAVLCMIMFDQLNVLYANCDGQEADESLLSILDLITKSMPASVQFARLSENTFALLLHKANTEYAEKLMQQMLSALSSKRIACQDKQFVVAASIGVVQISNEINTVPQLLRSVGSACVIAKTQGHNSVQVYAANSAQIKHEESLFKWAGLIDHVLDNDLLYLRCQRIQPISTAGSLLPHYEILLGIDKSLTTNPQEFILAAEKWQRSADIDLWVLQRIFTWLENQGDKLAYISGVSINLSGHSLTNNEVLAFITSHLQSSTIPANKIIFELTETAFMTNLAVAQQFIETVRTFGCRFSLDDFGSGYSSFAYLKNLHVDYLKIDGVFVRDLEKSQADVAMVKAMYSIGNALGLKIIAEYVENEAIFNILGEIGVDYAQGYGIEKPKPLDSLELEG
jgi:diguanylate cyclase (GGDEF)-like protein